MKWEERGTLFYVLKINVEKNESNSDSKELRRKNMLHQRSRLLTDFIFYFF